MPYQQPKAMINTKADNPMHSLFVILSGCQSYCFVHIWQMSMQM